MLRPVPSTPVLTTVDHVVAFYLDKGWLPHHAFGIAANISFESNFNLHEVGDGGKAWSLFQHHPDRQATFRSLYGKDMKQATVDEVLGFAHWELTSTDPRNEPLQKRAGDKLRATKNAYDAGATFSRYFERPLKKDWEADSRGQLAKKWHEAAIHAALNYKMPPKPKGTT